MAVFNPYKALLLFLYFDAQRWDTHTTLVFVYFRLCFVAYCLVGLIVLYVWWMRLVPPARGSGAPPVLGAPPAAWWGGRWGCDTFYQFRINYYLSVIRYCEFQMWYMYNISLIYSIKCCGWLSLCSGRIWTQRESLFITIYVLLCVFYLFILWPDTFATSERLIFESCTKL